MKAYRIRKRDQRLPVFIQEIRAPLRKPRFGRVVFFQVHEVECVTPPQAAAWLGKHSSPLPAVR